MTKSDEDGVSVLVDSVRVLLPLVNFATVGDSVAHLTE